MPQDNTLHAEYSYSQLAEQAPAAWAALPLAKRVAASPREERAALILGELGELAPGESIDLPDADLRGVDLRPGRALRARTTTGPALRPMQVVLDGANFAGATLCGANLAGVSLRRACLDGALLVGADLRGADLSGASLHGAHLSCANLARADLEGAVLRGASLLTADLTDATATGADFRDAVLHAAVLKGAILRVADLRWAHLDSANLAGALLDGAQFEGASLVMANLAGAHLSPSTGLSFAFLHQARLDRSNLCRCHLWGGVGEACIDLALARDTYRNLQHHFVASGHAADGRWAHRQAQRMHTATHRPDRADQYYAPPGAQSDQMPRSRRSTTLPALYGATPQAQYDAPPFSPYGRGWPEQIQRAGFYVAHGLRWLAGHLLELTTGYGTSFLRLVGTLVAVWLCFALFFNYAGAVINLEGSPSGWLQALRYSAAALTPVDAYPLVATADGARYFAVLEGMVGIVLLGALGYVAAARLGRD